MGIDCLLLSKMMRVKCITHNRGNCDLRSSQKYFVKYFDAVICISQSVLEHIQRQKVPTSNAIIIHDGIDHQKVLSSVSRSSGEVREEFGVTGNQPFIGIVGNIKEWKGQEVVVKAVGILKKTYPDIKCLLVGDCSNLKGDLQYLEYLRNRVKEEELSRNVVFTGYRRDILEIMNALDIVLHASIEPEPFGRVVLEAMVLGKPVIATNFGGPAEIIQDGDSGLLVPPGNANILAEATHSLLENPRERARIAEAGKARVAQFHLRHNVQKTEELYQKLLV
jgi:glycosyltransferase involved in cell wall biosynthesis